MNEEGGAGEEPLLSNPEMSYFKMLRGLFPVNSSLNYNRNGKPFFFLLAFSAEKTDCLLKFLDILNRI